MPRDRVLLVGLDFGTTTSCAVVASAEVMCNSVTGRMELSRIEQEFQSDQVFTPLIDQRLDEAKLAGYLDNWLGQIDRGRVLGGGAIVTGLAAQKENAAAFARQTRRYLQDAIVAVAEDPGLESWLAFMGNCAELSRAHPERLFLNLDIGGGTTNLAAGRSGEVFSVGSLFIGARHVQVVPGSYEIVRLSKYAAALLPHLGIRKQVGDKLTEHETGAIIAWYLDELQAVISGNEGAPKDAVSALHEQVAFKWRTRNDESAQLEPALTLSGGVGQLVYAHLQGAEWPSTTAFGDLGIDLARGLVESPYWRERLQAFLPTTLGRATAYGLLRYNTQVSGNTIFLSDLKLLPLNDLVLLGSVGPESSPAEIERLLALATGTANGACLRVDLPIHELSTLRTLAATMRLAIEQHPGGVKQPLVLLLRENLGKVFGQYLTNWQRSPLPLVVIDEVDPRDVQFAQVGQMREGVVPVSFYGMTPTGEPRGEQP